jgi:exosome complex RNA-binding protein Rrp4
MDTKLIRLSGLLLQSCYGYKSTDHENIEFSIDDCYKLKHAAFKKHKKGKVVAFNDSIITYKINNHNIEKLRVDGVQEIVKGKFSLAKTIALPVSIVVGFGGLIWLGPNTAMGDIGLGY